MMIFMWIYQKPTYNVGFRVIGLVNYIPPIIAYLPWPTTYNKTNVIVNPINSIYSTTNRWVENY